MDSFKEFIYYIPRLDTFIDYKSYSETAEEEILMYCIEWNEKFPAFYIGEL